MYTVLMITRSMRRLIARIGIATMLFAQVAVSAYACPALIGNTGFGNTAVAAAGSALAGMQAHCEEADTGNSNICRQHCQGANLSVESSPILNLPPVAPMQLTIADPYLPVVNAVVAILPVLLKRETASPPSILFRVFRI